MESVTSAALSNRKKKGSKKRKQSMMAKRKSTTKDTVRLPSAASKESVSTQNKDLKEVPSGTRRTKSSATIREKKKFYEPIKMEDHRVVAFRESR